MIIREKSLFPSGSPHIFKNLRNYRHIVVDTDYENYALVYGCDQYGIFWKGEYATLLSRSEFLDGRYSGKAKSKLYDLDYEYNKYWMEPGTTCGFEAAPSHEELMISLFEHEPLWSDFQLFNENTINTKLIYKKLFSTYPAGKLT